MFASDCTKHCLRAQKCHKISGGGGGGGRGASPRPPNSSPSFSWIPGDGRYIASQCIVTLCDMGLLIVNAISFGSLLQATSCFVIEEG